MLDSPRTTSTTACASERGSWWSAMRPPTASRTKGNRYDGRESARRARTIVHRKLHLGPFNVVYRACVTDDADVETSIVGDHYVIADEVELWTARVHSTEAAFATIAAVMPWMKVL